MEAKVTELAEFITKTLYAWNMSDPNNHHLENRLHVLNSEAQDIANKIAPAILAAGYTKSSPSPLKLIDGEDKAGLEQAITHIASEYGKPKECYNLARAITNVVNNAINKQLLADQRSVPDLEGEIEKILNATVNDFGSDCLFSTCEKFDRDCKKCKTSQLSSLIARHESGVKADGARLITQERQRQIEKEGWTQKHDDNMTSFALSVAGACYALSAAAVHGEMDDSWKKTYAACSRECFPFDREYWKPTPNDPIRQLVKAGALIAAEIDRLQRKLIPQSPSGK